MPLQVTIGSNIAQVLDQQLTYTSPVAAGTSLEVIIPSVFGGAIVVVCVMLIIFVSFYLNSRKKTVSIAMHEQIMELVANR